MRVVVVDRDALVLKSTALVLRTLGHEVHTAASPEEALRVTAQVKPHLLLQDAPVPGLDLPRYLRHLRQATPARDGLRIVLYSAALEVEELARLVPYPILEKPFTVADLERALRLLA